MKPVFRNRKCTSVGGKTPRAALRSKAPRRSTISDTPHKSEPVLSLPSSPGKFHIQETSTSKAVLSIPPSPKSVISAPPSPKPIIIKESNPKVDQAKFLEQINFTLPYLPKAISSVSSTKPILSLPASSKPLGLKNTSSTISSKTPPSPEMTISPCDKQKVSSSSPSAKSKPKITIIPNPNPKVGKIIETKNVSRSLKSIIPKIPSFMSPVTITPGSNLNLSEKFSPYPQITITPSSQLVLTSPNTNPLGLITKHNTKLGEIGPTGFKPDISIRPRCDEREQKILTQKPSITITPKIDGNNSMDESSGRSELRENMEMDKEDDIIMLDDSPQIIEHDEEVYIEMVAEKTGKISHAKNGITEIEKWNIINQDLRKRNIKELSDLEQNIDKFLMQYESNINGQKNNAVNILDDELKFYKDLILGSKNKNDLSTV